MRMLVMRAGVVAAIVGAAATAHAEPTPAIWVGVEQPSDPPIVPCDCDAMSAIAHAVVIVVPGARLPEGTTVHVLHPLVGMAVTGKLVGGKVALPGFIVDRRRNDDSVIVVAGDVKPALLTATPADVAAIKVVVGHAESLEGVHKATAKLEVGVVDLDGDGKPDVAATYGCKVWGDGVCQVPGQFVLVHKAGKWAVVE